MIREGLADLAARRESVASYLVQIGSRRMRRCGIEVPVSKKDVWRRITSYMRCKAANTAMMPAGATTRFCANW